MNTVLNPLHSLSDDDLWTRTHTAAQNEKQATLTLLKHLAEVEARRLFARRAFSSLFEYATKSLGYSESQASERIAAMRLLRDVDGVEEKVQSGALTLSSAAKIQRFFKKRSICLGKKTETDEKLDILRQCENKPSRQVDHILAELEPTLALEATERVRALDATHEELRFVIDAETAKLLTAVKSRTGHEPLAVIFKRALEAYADLLELPHTRDVTNSMCTSHVGASPSNIDRPTPQQPRESTDSCAETPVPAQPIRLVIDPKSCQSSRQRSRYIPRAIRKTVRSRAGGQCEYVDAKTKRRCESRMNLQFEHITPFARGGSHAVSNIKYYCPQHNRLSAIDCFGEGLMNRYLRTDAHN